jgi:hypothetical protein
MRPMYELRTMLINLLLAIFADGVFCFVNKGAINLFLN